MVVFTIGSENICNILGLDFPYEKMIKNDS